MQMQTKTLLKSLSSSLQKRDIQVISLGDPDVGAIVKHRIPTSSLTLNAAVGGGIPCGRLTEIFGEESNGKSSLVADIMASTQRIGGVAAIIDSEQSFDPSRAEAMGVNVSDVIYSDATTVEAAFTIMEEIFKEVRESDVFTCVVWDSVAQSSTEAEVSGEITDHHVGGKAKLLSMGLRKIIPLIGPKTALVFINQVRDKIGNAGWGKPTDTVGGWAVKFNASLRIELKRVGKIQKDEKSIGIKCSAYTVKNKTYPPFRRAEYDMLFEGGIEDSDYLLNALVKEGKIGQSGGWYTYLQTKRKFQRKDFKAFLLDLQSSEPTVYDEFIKLALKLYE